MQISFPTNTHSMQTRAKSGMHKSKVSIAASDPHQLMKPYKKKNWKQAIRDEFLALLRYETWSLVPLPANKKAIGCISVFKVEKNSDGTLQVQSST